MPKDRKIKAPATNTQEEGPATGKASNTDTTTENSDITSDTLTSKRPTGWRDAFLLTLANTGVVRAACKASGVSRQTAYVHRNTDAEFAEAWDIALEEGADVLEAEARRRAVHGTDKPVIYKGSLSIGPDGRPLTVKEYSDVLLIFLLKGARPEKYRDNFDLRKLLASLPESAGLRAAGDRDEGPTQPTGQ